jgi:hypothetical protein
MYAVILFLFYCGFAAKEIFMKSKITIFVLVLIVVMVVTTYAQEYNSESDFKARPIDSGKSAEIIGYTGSKWQVRIPPRIQGLPVTSIAREAFKGNENLTSVIIPIGVISIGERAFDGCKNLTNVNIPNGVTSIGDSAFAGSGIINITIPNSITSIGFSAFFGCSSLASITIPNIRDFADFTELQS